MRHATSRWFVLALASCSLWMVACDSETEAETSSESEAAEQAPEEPETYVSERAPYRLDLPEDWALTSPDEVNAHADVAASRGDDFFLIVIPQELPTVSGVAPPDVESLKSASLERMTDNVDDFSVEREGPVELDGTPAVSVFAEGTVEDEPVQYVTIYATRGDWGYQIVAWGPREAESTLVDAADAIADGWQFVEDSVNSPEPDVRPGSVRDVKPEDSRGTPD